MGKFTKMAKLATDFRHQNPPQTASRQLRMRTFTFGVKKNAVLDRLDLLGNSLL